MYIDVTNYNGCPQCAIVEGTGRKQKLLFQPIVIECPFQIVRVDIMELPVTAQGIDMQYYCKIYLQNWPLVFPIPDQKAEHIAHLLVEDFFCTRGYLIRPRDKLNLLSFLMRDICKLLGIKKLNTTVSTASHPQCNGAVEKFNRTFKSMLKK